MIHQYQLNGYNIVLDAGSASIHVVDDLAYEMIARAESAPQEELLDAMREKYRGAPGRGESDLRACLAEINELRQAGQLFSPDPYQDLAVDFKQRRAEIKALCLHVAHTCNLNCEYCFASQGKYHGERALMSFAVGRQALDFLIAASGARTNLEVDFFGGEPLLNWEVVKRLVAYARSQEEPRRKKFRFTLTTNGVLIDDEVIDFANREMHNVVLSLDGRKETHDRLRKNYAGEGSYDTILPKFQELVRRRGGRGYYIRGTFTNRNLDFTNDVFHLADLGFRELSMEPVVAAPGEPYALSESDLPALCEQYEILAREMLRRKREGRGFNFYHYLLDLTNGPCVYKRVSGCGVGSEYLAVTPGGELYPCHQFVGEQQYRLGSVWEGVTNRELHNHFKLCHAYAREECRECWARLYCSGGCAANACHAAGSITGVYQLGCALFKKRLECAIMLQAAQAEAAEEN